MLFHERLVPTVVAARHARQERERALRQAQAQAQAQMPPQMPPASGMQEPERLAAAERACRRAIVWRNVWAAGAIVLGVALVGDALWLRQADHPAAVAAVDVGRGEDAAADRSQGAAQASGHDPAASANPAAVVSGKVTAAVSGGETSVVPASVATAAAVAALVPVAPVVPAATVDPIATSVAPRPLEADRFPAPPADAAVFTSWRLQSKGCTEGPVAVTGTMRFWWRDSTLHAAFSAPPEANGGWTVEITARAPVPAMPTDRLELSTSGLWSSAGTRAFRTEGTDVVSLSGSRVVGAQMQTMRTLCGV